jgi:uncharacterized coiled-coil protein SlyX
MAFNLNDLKSKVESLRQSGTNLAQTGADKAKLVAAIAKLKAANLSEGETLRGAYEALGRLYYEKHGAAPEVEFLNACATISEAQTKIDVNKAKMDQLTQELTEVAPVVIVPEAAEAAAPAEVPASEETPASDPLADLDDFIQQANAAADQQDPQS